MSTIAAGKVVLIHYTLKNDVGDVLDSSVGDEPLPYLHGEGNIVDGLEEALLGRSIGDEFSVAVPPEKGYGLREQGEPQAVARDLFPEDLEIEEGMQFMVETDEGHAPVWVVGVEGDQVLVDGNHPLSGLTLHFTVSIEGLRDATAEEVAHGHPHGPDGHGHHHH